DLLGSEILAKPGDPAYAEVAACLAPVKSMETFSFVGTEACFDKVGVTYGGRTACFDPAAFIPSIQTIRERGQVIHGLVDWLPVLRFVYPQSEGTWIEMLMFARLGLDCRNDRVQPVWYRLCEVEDNCLKSARYFDSYIPTPINGAQAEPSHFYAGLLELKEGCEKTIPIDLGLPDQRVSSLARHSLKRAQITRIQGFPKYGVMNRNYGGSEHDGFQDTFNVEASALLEWGLFERAKEVIDNYFTHFVRSDGSILYRGAETGQYGRVLTVVAQYQQYTGDSELTLKHKEKVEAILGLLLRLRREAQALDPSDPSYGMICGYCEADSCLDPDPQRYHKPYFSNSAEAVRGLHELGRAWQRENLSKEAEALRHDLKMAMERSYLHGGVLPSIAGAKESHDDAHRRSIHDPQARAYRAFNEMFFSGTLRKADVAAILAYRTSCRDILLGVPTAYGYSSGEMAGFLAYGHAYGLLQHGYVREFLLTFYSLSAHQYTRGLWTAPETRRLDSDQPSAPYCVPAQLVAPLLTRWMLVFEEPFEDELWLLKAAPSDWFSEGSSFSARALPTRWGKMSVSSRTSKKQTVIQLTSPPAPSLVASVRRPFTQVTLNGAVLPSNQGVVVVPAEARGEIELVFDH
ncbi:MAG: hypothetical protein ABUL49_00685, partial [bacterium]